MTKSRPPINDRDAPARAWKATLKRGGDLLRPLARWNHQPCDQIDQEAESFRKYEKDEEKPNKNRVDAEVVAEAGRDAGDSAIPRVAAEQLRLRVRCGLHDSTILERHLAHNRDCPAPFPDSTLSRSRGCPRLTWQAACDTFDGMATRGVGIQTHKDGVAGRLYRSRDERVVAGVAAGMAHYLRVNPLWLRLAFVVGVFAGGVGVLVYALGWVLIRPAEPGEELSRFTLPRRGKVEILGGALVLIGALFVLRSLGFWLGDGFVWPALLVFIGLVLLWRRAAPERKSQLLAELRDLRARRISPTVAELLGHGADAARSGRPELKTLARLTLGVVFIVAGVGAFAATSDAFRAVRDGVIAMLVVLVGLVLIFGPWAWRLASELAEERRERVRSQERSEVAAHLHDSVLQTLALIQKEGNDSQQMVQLARRQERELRAWLYGDARPHGRGVAGKGSERGRRRGRRHPRRRCRSCDCWRLRAGRRSRTPTSSRSRGSRERGATLGRQDLSLCSWRSSQTA